MIVIYILYRKKQSIKCWNDSSRLPQLVNESQAPDLKADSPARALTFLPRYCTAPYSVTEGQDRERQSGGEAARKVRQPVVAEKAWSTFSWMWSNDLFTGEGGHEMKLYLWLTATGNRQRGFLNNFEKRWFSLIFLHSYVCIVLTIPFISVFQQPESSLCMSQKQRLFCNHNSVYLESVLVLPEICSLFLHSNGYFGG